MAQYPVLGYQVGSAEGATGTFKVRVTGGGGTTETVTLNAGLALKWGFATTGGSGLATSDSLAKAVHDAIIAHTQITAHGLTDYVYGVAAGTLPPTMTFTVECAVTPSTIELVEDGTTTAGLLAALGFSSTTVALTNTSGNVWSVTTSRHFLGCWTPNLDGVMNEPDVEQVSFRTGNPMATDVATTVRWGSVDRKVLDADYVEGRHVFNDYASDTAYATRAGSSTSDTYGTLERLVEADSRDRLIRIYTASGVYGSKAWQLDREGPQSVRALAPSESQGGMMHHVRLPLRRAA